MNFAAEETRQRTKRGLSSLPGQQRLRAWKCLQRHWLTLGSSKAKLQSVPRPCGFPEGPFSTLLMSRNGILRRNRTCSHTPPSRQQPSLTLPRKCLMCFVTCYCLLPDEFNIVLEVIGYGR